MFFVNFILILDKKEDDDNFFDANDTFDLSLSSLDRKPLGRAQVFDSNAYLFNHPDRLIYVPTTQVYFNIFFN